MSGWLRATMRRLFPNWRLPNRMDSVLRLAGQAEAVLDIGCGTGDVAAHLRAKLPEARIVGLDFQRYAGADLGPLDEFIEFDIAGLLEPGARLPFADGGFDTVLLVEVIEHLVQPHCLLAEIHRVLRPGGALVVTCPNLHALENRLAVLLGTRGSLFPSKMAYNLPADVDVHRHGHVATYSFFTLRRLVAAMGLRVERQLGFGLPVPVLEGFQRPILWCFPRWASHIGLRAARVDVAGYEARWAPCARTGGAELVLPGERCVAPHPHIQACLECPYFHMNWLHPRDPRRPEALAKLRQAGREPSPERLEPWCW